MKELNTISGRIKIDIHNPDGSLARSTGWISNIITNAGKAQVALLMGDASAVPFTYLAVGTSSTAVAATDTTLGAEIVDTGLARAAATVSRVTTTVANDTLQLVYTWTASGSKTVEEAGIFNAASAGTMLGHALTGSQVLSNGQAFTLTYQVKQA
jgi:hypothetical protein